MKSHDYTATILVDQTAEKAFAAIKNVRGWWSEDIEGSTDKVGDVFSYHYEDAHRCKMRLVELVSNRKVTWLVTENHFNFTKDPNEWKGTRVVFEISRRDGKTQVRFTHKGLVPAFECYDVCSNAWGTYITGSLRDLITKGKGQPNRKDR